MPAALRGPWAHGERYSYRSLEQAKALELLSFGPEPCAARESGAETHPTVHCQCNCSIGTGTFWHTARRAHRAPICEAGTRHMRTVAANLDSCALSESAAPTPLPEGSGLTLEPRRWRADAREKRTSTYATARRFLDSRTRNAIERKCMPSCACHRGMRTCTRPLPRVTTDYQGGTQNTHTQNQNPVLIRKPKSNQYLSTLLSICIKICAARHRAITAHY